MAERALRLEGARAWFESNGSKFSCAPKIWRDEFIDSGIYPNDSIANQVFTDNQIRFEELLVVGVAKLGLSANGKRLTSTFNEVRAAYRDAAT
jgi:hypothetical protein